LSRPQNNLPRLRAAFIESNLPMLVDILDWARIPEPFRREIQRHPVAIVTIKHSVAA
jgi:hypothetical protein